MLKLLKELFEEELGYENGLEYQMVALQAVMAEQLDGDTLHHACGIDPFAREQGNDGKQAKRQAEVAKKVLQWRWLIIDEISMVNVKLLAEVDMIH